MAKQNGFDNDLSEYDRYMEQDHGEEPEPPSAEELEREAEERTETLEAERLAEHERYMEWLTERAQEAVERALGEDGEALTGEDSVAFDFTNVPARDAYDLAEISGEMDAADLLMLDIPAAQDVVEGVLPEGTTALAAPPKIGKSVMCYQLAVECALGGTFLGRAVHRGSVLYLALEDGKRRGQDRLKVALHGRRMPRGRLTVRWAAPPIGNGLEEVIEEWLTRHPDAVLVIIDTLGRVRKGSDGRRNAYEVDVEDLGRLQSLFKDKQGMALLIVHHTAKRSDYDFLASISGTYGIPGSVDTVAIIARQRLVEIATLTITGRDIAEAEIAVRFANMHWELATDVIPGMSAERHAVLDSIRANGPILPAAIGRELRMQRTAVQHHVEGLVRDGYIARIPGGYVVVGESGDDNESAASVASRDSDEPNTERDKKAVVH